MEVKNPSYWRRDAGRGAVVRSRERRRELTCSALWAEGVEIGAVTPVAPPLGCCDELVDLAPTLQAADNGDFVHRATIMSNTALR